MFIHPEAMEVAKSAVIAVLRKNNGPMQFAEVISKLRQHRYPSDLTQRAVNSLVDDGEAYFTGSGCVVDGMHPSIPSKEFDWKSRYGHIHAGMDVKPLMPF